MTVIATLIGDRRVALAHVVGVDAGAVVDEICEHDDPRAFIKTREGAWVAIDKIVMLEDVPGPEEDAR